MTAPTHVFVIYIRTSPEKLWDAITRPEFTRQYFHETAIESDFQAGSAVTYRMSDGRPAVVGRVIECTRPSKLVITWHFEYSDAYRDEPPSRVTFLIEQSGKSCKLTVIHDEFAGETATYKAVGGGWPGVLSSLKSLLETGEPLVYE